MKMKRLLMGVSLLTATVLISGSLPVNATVRDNLSGQSKESVVEDFASEIGDTTADASHLLEGQTAWIRDGKSVKLLNGTMSDKSNSTIVATSIIEDGINAKIKIPTTGCYDAENSYIAVPIQTIKNNITISNKKTIGSSNSVESRSFNVRQILPNDYNKLTINNFELTNVSLGRASSSGYDSYGGILGSYDANSGILYCNASRRHGGNGDYDMINYTVICTY